MPDFEFTSPEGKKYTVTGPEGATQEQAWQMLQKQISPSKPEPQGGLWNSAVDFFKSIGSGVGQGLADTASAEGRAAESVQTGGQTPTVPGAEESRKIMGAGYEPQGALGRTAQSVGRAFGTPSSYMMPGGPLAKAAGITGGAVGSQLGAEMSDSPIAPIVGGIVGGAVPGLRGAGRAVLESTARVNPLHDDPVRQALVNTLRHEGIEPDAAAVRGSKGVKEFQRFGSLPGGGGSYRDLKTTQGDQLTQAVMAHVGEPGVTEASPAVWSRAKDRLSQQYESAIDRIGVTFPRDDMKGNNAFRDAVNDLRTKAIMEADTPETTAKIHKLLDRLLPSKAPGDLWYTDKKTGLLKMRGKSFQELNKMDGPIDVMIGNASTKRFGLEIKSLLNDWVEKSARGPKQKEALDLFRNTNNQYRAFKVAINSVGDDAAKSGHIDPERLARAIGDEETLQMGKTGLDQLANASRNILEPYRPLGFGGAHESGGRGMVASAGRMGAGATAGAAAGAVLGGTVGAIPGAVAGAVAPGALARRINSPGVQAYIKGRADFRDYLRKRGLLTTPAQCATTAVRTLGGGATIGAQNRRDEKKRPRIYE